MFSLRPREMMDPMDADDNLELNAETEAPVEDKDAVHSEEEAPKLAADDVDVNLKEEDVAPAPAVEVGGEASVSSAKLPGGWFYFSKSGVSPLYRTVQTFPGIKSNYGPWLVPRQWAAPLSNEIKQDTGYNKHLAFYPYYAYRKGSH